MRAAILSTLLALAPASAAPSGDYCATFFITGYLKSAGNPWTFDGTDIMTEEPIIAASWEVPLDAKVYISNLGQFRVADRGPGLRWRHLDVPVNDLETAYSLTGYRTACVSFN